MSYLSIKGIKTSKKRSLIRNATEHMISALIGDRMSLNVEIKFTNLKEDENCYGVCEWIDDPVRPRRFMITIDNKQNLREQLKTLAHELVHVKQYCRGELYDYQRGDTNRTRWRNTIINNEVKSLIEYKKLPWEKEAFGLQSVLVRNFLKERKHNLKDYSKCS